MSERLQVGVEDFVAAYDGVVPPSFLRSHRIEHLVPVRWRECRLLPEQVLDDQAGLFLRGKGFDYVLQALFQ